MLRFIFPFSIALVPREDVLEEGKSQNTLPGCPGRVFWKKVNLKTSSLGVQGGSFEITLFKNTHPGLSMVNVSNLIGSCNCSVLTSEGVL